jgi:beta-glucanase (GH16 family)
MICLLLLAALMIGGGAARAAESGWKLVWSDEFDGTAIDRAKWGYDLGAWQFNNEREFYTDRPENSFVKDGLLHIRALKEQYQGRPYTSARMVTKGLFGKQYGRFEFLDKLPLGKGLWPALWLMPVASSYGSWPASGEIDMMEARGQEPGKVCGTIHFGSRAPKNVHIGENYILPDKGSIADFHVYALEWEPGAIRWLVDGKPYQTRRWWWSSSRKGERGQGLSPRSEADLNPWPAPFDKPFYLIMNLAVGGNFLGYPDEKTPFPSEMVVDYVRVYDKVGGYGKPLPAEAQGRKVPFEKKPADGVKAKGVSEKKR